MVHPPPHLGRTSGDKGIQAEAIRDRQRIGTDEEEEGILEHRHGLLTMGHGEVSVFLSTGITRGPHVLKRIVWQRIMHPITL